jgi:hypothetical protein
MMTNLTPSLKADLSLIFQELAQDSGELLDVKLSKVSEWCKDRAIDLDSLCVYIADLCASRQIDYEQLRTLADNLIHSDATSKQILQQVDDLAPELLKELVLQASIASTELDKMKNEAGGNKTVHWIANHPIESAGIGVGVVVVGGGISYGISCGVKYILERRAQRAENAEQHIVEGVDHVNDQLREHVNHEVEHVTENQIELDRAALDECLRGGEYRDLMNLLEKEVRNKLARGLKEVSRDEPYFKKLHEVARSEPDLKDLEWTLSKEARICQTAHFERWPDQLDAMADELAGSILRILHPRTYLREFRHWEWEEQRKATELIITKESDGSELIDRDRSEMQLLENHDILRAEEELAEDYFKLKFPVFDKDEALKAEAQLAKLTDVERQAFEKSDHFAEFVKSMKRYESRFWDFNGMAQVSLQTELRQYYQWANSKCFDGNLVSRGEGVIELEKDIVERYRRIDSREVRALKEKAYESMFTHSGLDLKPAIFQQEFYKEVVIYPFFRNKQDFRSRYLSLFKTEENVDKWLAPQESLIKLYNPRYKTGGKLQAKLDLISDVIDYRVREGYSKLRREARLTLEQYSHKAEEDLSVVERDMKNKALMDLERSDMLVTYCTRELENAVNTLESEAAALLEESKQEAVDWVQASERKAESDVDSALDAI